MSSVLVIDTEVASLSTNEVIQLAWLPVPFVEGIPPEVRCFRPVGRWDLGAVATHHILPDDVIDCPPSENAVRELPHCDYVIGHNIDFDANALGGLPYAKRICTLALARKEWPDLDSHKLGALIYHICGMTEEARKLTAKSHDAGADVWACYLIVDEILKTHGKRASTFTNWEGLWTASENARIPTVMTFGKYKGTRIAEVPSDYKKWLLAQSDVDPYLRKALSAK